MLLFKGCCFCRLYIKKTLFILVEIYLSSLKDPAHMITVIRTLQRISLDRNIAKLISEQKQFISDFVPTIKSTEALDIKYNSIQLLSNMCAHNLVSKSLLKEHQDFLFAELSDLVLIEPKSDIDTLVHQSSISFFYNLISAYHLEDHVSLDHHYLLLFIHIFIFNFS